jgi:transposase
MSRVEVLSGPERRRRWSAEQKRSIVAEAFAPGASVCEVARRWTSFPGKFIDGGAIYERPRWGLPRWWSRRVWIAAGHTDMRRGMQSLALQVQEAVKRDPHAGDLYVFRGRSGSLIRILWHDGIGMSLYAKRLERGRFIWPSATAGAVSISTSQLAYMLDGIDWRNPQHTWRPTAAG